MTKSNGSMTNSPRKSLILLCNRRAWQQIANLPPTRDRAKKRSAGGYPRFSRARAARPPAAGRLDLSGRFCSQAAQPKKSLPLARVGVGR